MNTRLTEFDQTKGYRFANLASEGNSDELFVILTFSGGGTRAAALSYGVLEQLKDTTVKVAGEERRLLDEVDVISSVSGGSFTAAYYAVFGDRVFEDFAERFLNRKIRSALLVRAAMPHNLVCLGSSKFDAGDLAERYYAERIFDEASYGDLVKKGRRPFLIVNATDMTMAAPFAFTQDQFDLLYSDLGSVPISKAVAASAAFPVLLGGLVVRNYERGEDFREPGWIRGAIEEREKDFKCWEKARQALSYGVSEKRPYIHLLDGGVVDNLGLHPVLWSLTSEHCGWSLKKMIEEGRISKLLIVVVNAGARKASSWDEAADRPTVFGMFDATIAGLQEGQTSESLARLREVRDELEEMSSPETKFYLAEISFDLIPYAFGRRYFNSLPTDLELPKRAVEDLRLVGGELLRQSEDYCRLLEDLDGSRVPLEEKITWGRRVLGKPRSLRGAAGRKYIRPSRDVKAPDEM